MKKGLSLAFLISLLCAILFVVLALSIRRDWIVSFDRTIIGEVQGWETAGLTRFMEALSWIGTTKVVITLIVVIMLFLYFVLGHRRELIFFVWVCLGAYLLNVLIKSLFKRERPDLHRIVEEVGYSFPSGHSMVSFALYGSLAYLLWRHVSSKGGRSVLLVINGLIIAGIGLSRIYLGVHYPSDVLGGYIASGCWLTLAIWLGGRWIKGGRTSSQDISSRQ
ncbi:phosphatase PAP2 family protein [Paenibacillus physcomitrellae]|uniref:phosphatase PAP2 family protein n=1 Tax=Paenibacillus physcomitrellae TaxID=1619311 RepID=UPI001E33F647|nr:phosphatase PAP2 family protein [Paenibacillus physcomitrellae]